MSTPRLRGGLLATAAAGLLACLGACVTEDAQGNPVPKRGVPEQPEGLEAGAVLQLVDQAIDEDGDGYIDTIPVSVYLFASDQRVAIPIWLDGHFEFALLDDDKRTIDEWTFTPEETASMRAILGAVGRGYRLILQLSEPGGEDAPGARAGLLYCRFVPVGGEPVRTRQPTSVIVGRTGLMDGQ